MQTTARTYFNKLLFQKILLAGVVAGALDALAAIIDFYIETGKNPVRIFVFIASGVFGKQVFAGSQFIAIFGVIFHFLIAIIFSAFYFWIYPVIRFLHKSRVFSAVLYGIFVWLVMNLLVVPLTITHSWAFPIMKVLLAALILIVCMGLPISFMAASFYKRSIYTSG